MFQSVPHMLMHTIEMFPDRDLFRYRHGRHLIRITYREFGDILEDLVHGFAAIGIRRGDRIAILSENRVEWVAVDFAAMITGAVVVPVYHTLSPDQIAFILMDAGVRILFLENRFYYEKFAAVRDQLPKLKLVMSFEQIKAGDYSPTLFKRLLRLGEKHRQSKPGWFEKQLKQIDPESICSIVYTSGTTGDPKGARLHHEGFINNIVNTECVFGLSPEDVFLSFVPLSHLYERVAGHWCPMYRGCCISYARSLSTVIEDIQRTHPTVLVSVPQLYDKIAATTIRKARRLGAFKRQLFFYALGIGKRYREALHEGKPPLWLRMGNAIADRLVFRKFRDHLGGSLRRPISGGAPLAERTARFFEIMGIPITEGYGLTETHLVVTLTPPGTVRYGSCGKPIPGVEVRIAEDGEVLVHGETLMDSYHERPDITRMTIDEEGWLHTGDIGHLDEQNFLYITDRKKNIIVTSTGDKIAPMPIERKLKESPYISEVCLIGNGRKFVSALIEPDMDAIMEWARKLELPFEGLEELLASRDLHRLLKHEINTRQKQQAGFERVKKFVVLDHPLDVLKGELTPTLKMRRTVLEGIYWEEIDELYSKPISSITASPI